VCQVTRLYRGIDCILRHEAICGPLSACTQGRTADLIWAGACGVLTVCMALCSGGRHVQHKAVTSQVASVIWIVRPCQTRHQRLVLLLSYRSAPRTVGQLHCTCDGDQPVVILDDYVIPQRRSRILGLGVDRQGPDAAPS
jgi:hypothetical protein